MRQIAPWPDFAGHPIQEGDRVIRHCGDTGVVVLLQGAHDDPARWQVNYGPGNQRSLAEEVSPSGRAVVVDESGKDL